MSNYLDNQNLVKKFQENFTNKILTKDKTETIEALTECGQIISSSSEEINNNFQQIISEQNINQLEQYNSKDAQSMLSAIKNYKEKMLKNKQSPVVEFYAETNKMSPDNAIKFFEEQKNHFKHDVLKNSNNQQSLLNNSTYSEGDQAVASFTNILMPNTIKPFFRGLPVMFDKDGQPKVVSVSEIAPVSNDFQYGFIPQISQIVMSSEFDIYDQIENQSVDINEGGQLQNLKTSSVNIAKTNFYKNHIMAYKTMNHTLQGLLEDKGAINSNFAQAKINKQNIELQKQINSLKKEFTLLYGYKQKNSLFFKGLVNHNLLLANPQINGENFTDLIKNIIPDNPNVESIVRFLNAISASVSKIREVSISNKEFVFLIPHCIWFRLNNIRLSFVANSSTSNSVSGYNFISNQTILETIQDNLNRYNVKIVKYYERDFEKFNKLENAPVLNFQLYQNSSEILESISTSAEFTLAPLQINHFYSEMITLTSYTEFNSKRDNNFGRMTFRLTKEDLPDSIFSNPYLYN